MLKFLNRISYHKRRWIIAYVFMLPSLFVFLPFFVIPLIRAITRSFHYHGNFVGFENYVYLLTTPRFWQSLKVTSIFSFGFTFLSVTIALLLAFLLHQGKWIKGRNFFRSAYFFPQMVALVIIGLIWQYMFDGNFGIINYILSLIGIESINWLQSSTFALGCLIFVQVWYTLGYNMMLLLAGLQGINDTYYEAAEIDGAGWFRKLLNVTIPLLLPSLLFVILISILNGFVNSFVLARILTQGGPMGSTNVLVHYIYEVAFFQFDMETANALTIITFMIMLGLAFIMYKIQESSHFGVEE